MRTYRVLQQKEHPNHVVYFDDVGSVEATTLAGAKKKWLAGNPTGIYRIIPFGAWKRGEVSG